MSNFSAVAVSRLQLRLDAPLAEQAVDLYANGRMQVRVEVLLSGIDSAGQYVALTRADLKTVQLVRGDNGQPLGDGWQVSEVENEYSHDLSGRPFSASDELAAEIDSRAQRLVFWVSSTVAESLTITAKVVVDGQVFSSNTTRHLASVALNAVVPEIYGLADFKFERVKGPYHHQIRIHKYYLGLFPASSGGAQVKLQGWKSLNNSTGRTVDFLQLGKEEYGMTIGQVAGFLVSVGISTYRMYCYANGGTYATSVNERVGQLTLPQLTAHGISTDIDKQMPFNFSAIDEYGTEHKLLIRTSPKDDIKSPEADGEYYLKFILGQG